MVYRRAFRKKRIKRRTKLYATKASMMSKSLAKKRYGQVSTKTFYFKGAGTIDVGPGGVTNFAWRTQNGADPVSLPLIPGDYSTVAELYQEYKVLAVKVRLFAANIGVESDPEIGTNNPFNRGNTVMYIDQDINPNEQAPGLITNVINQGSCRMIPSRCDKYTKVMYRAKGNPDWGCCDTNVPVASRQPDSWFAGIFLLGNNASSNIPNKQLWYYTVTYKVLFRGRNYQT